MFVQAIAFLLCAPAASAWSAGSRRGSVRPSSIAGYGSLLANIGTTLRSSSSSSYPLFLANADDGGGEGECAVTPEIPASFTNVAPTTDDASTSLSRKPQTGDVVTFTLLRFQPTDGTVLEPLFDTTGTLQLVLNGGNYLPGLHQLLSTMTPGETIEGTSIDAGYGGYRSDLVLKVPTSDIGDAIDSSAVTIGTTLQMGNGMTCRVTEMTDEMWTLDANHALAGAAYDVDVKLERVEEGPKQWEFVGDEKEEEDRYKVATFALGCFWGGELAFQRMPGVIFTSVGYTQGQKLDPTYEEVSSGTTGHTEAIQVIYDPNVVPYKLLVQLGLDRLGADVYKLNQVGNDRGTQYRHGIYYHNEEQRTVAEELLNGLGGGDKEVMTELKDAGVYYIAEDYHQQYLLKGGQSAKKGVNENIRCYG